MNLKKNGYEQKLYATFEGLELLENEDAYCLTVFSDDHLWTVNGLLTKNTEITLNTSAEETAVCNLGSINLSKFVKRGRIMPALLAKTVTTAIRMLDNVIDLCFYPTEEARSSNMKHRPIGLGVMGLQDALFLLNLDYDSEEAIDFSDEIQEIISYNAILASSQLAKERGAYESFKGSKWDRDILPYKTMDLLESERGEKIEGVKFNPRLDWSEAHDSIKEHGMRNSNVMAIAPTATISCIAGCFPCTEPIFKNIYAKANISGEFTVVNKYLVNDLKKLGLWGKDMLDSIKYYDGNLQRIENLPDKIKSKYKEAFEIDPLWVIKHAAARGKWIDQSQSVNIFIKGESLKKLHETYFQAWKYGLKTTYYLRTQAVSQIEKATLDASKFGFTQKRDYADISSNGNGHANSNGHSNGQYKACRLDDPTCEACQ